MHTAEEAEKLWCPHVRPVHVVSPDDDSWAVFDGRGLNADHSPLDTFHVCIGPSCMAWRWDERSFVHDPTPSDPAGGPMPEEFWRGYCGLAGKP